MTVVIDGTNGVSGVDGTASNPSYEGTDSNTGIFFPAADTIAFATAGTEDMRLNSSGQLILNTTGTAYTTDGVNARYQIGGTTQAASSMALITSSATTTTDPTIFLAKNKSGTQGTFTTAVVNTDELGAIRFAGSNTSTLATGAEIKGVAKGTWTTGSLPTDLVFSTVQGGTTTLNEAMRLTQNQEVLIGTGASGVTEVAGYGLTLMSSSGGSLNFYRNDTTVSSGNSLGIIDFYSNGSGSILYAATIGAEATGTFTASSTPTALTFDTCASGATAPVERMRIDSSGVITSTLGGMQVISGTAVTASGTSVDFTGIPSWVKRITVMFSGVSLSGSAFLLIQLGDSGGIETSGYISSTCNQSGTVTSSTSGYVAGGQGAALIFSGTMTISALGSNAWISSHTAKLSTSATCYGGGDKTLSDTLDRIRITTTNGTDTFDAGTINILYE